MIRVAQPIALFAAAIVLRILAWHSVYQRGGIHPNGNDAYYHFRRIRYSIDHFPEVLGFDPLINFPHGAQPIWSPSFDWLIASVLRLLPGIDQPGRLEAYAVWIPPLLGAMTVVLLYFVALRFYSRFVALVAAGALAALPAHTFYSLLGMVDHHVLVAAVSTVMLAISIQMFRDAPPIDEERDLSRKYERLRPGLCIGLGIAIAALVLVWPGALLHVGVLQVAMVARLVSTTTTKTAIDWAMRFACVHLTACVAVYPLSAGNEWALWGTVSPVVLSDFQPFYFFAGALCFGALCIVWRQGWMARNRALRAAGSIAVGITVLIGFLWAFPDVRVGVADALSWFAKEEEFQSAVSESIPIFGGPDGLYRALLCLTGFVFFVPAAIGYLGWESRHRSEQLLVLWWAFAFFMATLVQWRFMNTYSIAHCLLIGITMESLHKRLSPYLTNPFRTGSARVVVILSFLLAFTPAAIYQGPNIENILRSVRGQPTQPVGKALEAGFKTAAARFLRDHSASMDPMSYSVLGPWGVGHILKYVAERPVVQDNFGDDVAPENFRRAEEYFSARTESDALEILESTRTRYVLVMSVGSGHSQGYSADSLFSRLYHRTGSRGKRTIGGNRRALRVESLEHHRLIYQSPPLQTGMTDPFCMLFEVVPGARLIGHADPGAIVRASLPVRPQSGTRFNYVSQTEANDAGEYSIVLPYSNESVSDDVEVDPAYTVWAGRSSASISIPESAVQDGGIVEGPDLDE